MCSPAAPAVPSAQETASAQIQANQATAQAQTASNKDTAIATSNLNAVNQRTPTYNLDYAVTGYNPDGTPIRTATTTFTPQTQKLFDTTQATNQNLADLAQTQSGRLPGLLANPIDWSQQQGYLNNLTDSALDKSWDQQRASLDTALANKGIAQGSDAYTRAVNDFQQSRSQAYNSANVSNYNTALQSQLALRNQPLNEILALAGQGQISGPQFAATPQSSISPTGIGGVDIAGLMGQQYQNQYAQYQNAQNQNNQLLGGLFGLGASALTAFSDRRLKTDIHRVGRLPNGIPLYTFRYLWADQPSYGAMADEVMQIMPEAVGLHESGYLTVNYGKLLGLA